MKIIFKIMMLYNNKGRLKHDCFRRPLHSNQLISLLPDSTASSVNQSAS